MIVAEPGLVSIHCSSYHQLLAKLGSENLHGPAKEISGQFCAKGTPPGTRLHLMRLRWTPTSQNPRKTEESSTQEFRRPEVKREPDIR